MKDFKMKEKLNFYHKELNNKDILPYGIYRRNDINYPLICYINNILGAYISLNFDIIPLFINRAYKHISNKNNTSKNKNEVYYPLVLKYLIVMTEFILTQNLKNVNILLPKELLSS